MGVSALLLFGMPARAAEPLPTLVIGRTADESLLAEISQRIVTEAFGRASIPLEVRRLPLLRSLESANDGEIDGDLYRIAEVAGRFPNLMRVPTAINKVDITLYSASPAIASKSRAEIPALKTVYGRGVFVLKKYGSEMAATEATSEAAATEMAVRGRVDLMLGVYIDIQSGIVAGKLTGLHVWPHVWASESLYMLLHRRHAALVPRIDAAFQQMKKEGLIDKYYADGLRSAGVRPLDH